MFTAVTLLLDNVVDETTRKTFAQAILTSMDIHEESFNGEGYDLTLEQACSNTIKDSNLPDFYKNLLITMLNNYWNDSEMWAESILD